jgi:hypothetical protein
MPSKVRLAVAVLSLAAAASAAQAQFAFQEPPDMTGQSVGTVSPGVNTVRGGISATILVGGQIFGDFEDGFGFTIPTGMRATSVQVVISNFTELFSTSGVFISGPGLFTEVPITGNGTINLTGVLNSGSYGVLVWANNFDDSGGNISFTHQTRITAEFANDACASAVAIGLGGTPFSTATATTDGPDHPVQCNFFNNPGISRDVWFAFTAPAVGEVTAQTCGATFDTELAVYSSTNCGTLTSTIITCNDDSPVCGGNGRQSLVRWVANAGQTYLIRVGGFNNSVGTGTLTLSQFTSGACCNRQTASCLPLLESTCTGLGLTFNG